MLLPQHGQSSFSTHADAHPLGQQPSSEAVESGHPPCLGALPARRIQLSHHLGTLFIQSSDQHPPRPCEGRASPLTCPPRAPLLPSRAGWDTALNGPYAMQPVAYAMQPVAYLRHAAGGLRHAAGGVAYAMQPVGWPTPCSRWPTPCNRGGRGSMKRAACAS